VDFLTPAGVLVVWIEVVKFSGAKPETDQTKA
jgi:hypothetical protein